MYKEKNVLYMYTLIHSSKSRQCVHRRFEVGLCLMDIISKCQEKVLIKKKKSLLQKPLLTLVTNSWVMHVIPPPQHKINNHFVMYLRKA